MTNYQNVVIHHIHPLHNHIMPRRMMPPSDQNMDASPPPTNTTTTPKESSKEDKELATILVLILLVASCHPCLSQGIATQLQISVEGVRNAMVLTAVAVVVALMMVFAGKGNASSIGKVVNVKKRA